MTADPAEAPPWRESGLARKLVAEGVGSAMLLAVVVGSGIMGERLSGGNAAIALLGNTVATGAGLVVLISIFGPISGAHFNPIVTAMFVARRGTPWVVGLGYALVQFVGAVLGVFTAHVMFAMPTVQVSEKVREGPHQAFAEAVATFGLIAVILGALRFRPQAAPMLIGLYITAAYWFTASTSFANPAVAVARSFTNTFTGIAPTSVPGFILGECLGGVLAVATFGWLFAQEHKP
ncbi:aquaporin [Phenylobacterium immobile]|uniref:aquaporin n=1 Tax=Phenylobacterium immobile TaxID=21 RepID=UPI000B1174CC|nr:MIP/aquaporin family protein [Phenylobacterium immobile]